MAGRAVGFFKRRFFGKKARYLPAKQTLDVQRADPAAKTWPTIRDVYKRQTPSSA